jgi:hypothetical protein
VQLSFDVSLPERAQRIRDLVGTARTCIIEIGRELIAAKTTVAHGDWLPWIEDEFGWKERTAENYMMVARKFASVAEFGWAETAAQNSLRSPRHLVTRRS